MPSLLDINVLIPLLDENHSKHPAVADWFTRHVEDGWTSCPLTQNGFVRIMSQPSYPNRLDIGEAARKLRDAVSTPYHQFLADDISLLDNALVDANNLSGPRQITDVYLLALAVAHGIQLVTLDKRLPLNAVRGAQSESLVVL